MSVCEPEVALVPLHAPLAVHEVAFPLDQVSVDELPEVTEAGETERETVGAGVVPLVYSVGLSLPTHTGL